MTSKNDPLCQEFVRLLANSGWSQSEAARQLRLTSGTISQYMSGDTRPSPTTLLAFKCLIGDKLPLPGETKSVQLKDGPANLEEGEQTLFNELRRMEKPDRDAAVKHFRGLTELMQKREVSYRKSSSVPDGAKRAVSDMLDKGRKVGP
ncbi:MAG: helix-turn-helix domain-containing protein [Akkermansiaceae bacterium]|nr:helix-turn-helix domain-containing protein [Verrucomicrobiales bacterium]